MTTNAAMSKSTFERVNHSSGTAPGSGRAGAAEIMGGTVPKRVPEPKRKSTRAEISLETGRAIAPIDAMAECKTFYDERAASRPAELKRHYHRLLRNYFAFLVPPGQRVLELGCGLGDLVSHLQAARAVG